METIEELEEREKREHLHCEKCTPKDFFDGVSLASECSVCPTRTMLNGIRFSKRKLRKSQEMAKKILKIFIDNDCDLGEEELAIKLLENDLVDVGWF